MPAVVLLLIGVLLILVGFFVPVVPWGVLCWIAGGLLILSMFVGPYRTPGRRWW